MHKLWLAPLLIFTLSVSAEPDTANNPPTSAGTTQEPQAPTQPGDGGPGPEAGGPTSETQPLTTTTAQKHTPGAPEETTNKRAPRLTHNLSATTNLLDQGQCTAGLQLVACGITKNLSVGSSVWMWTDYRMGNASLRYKLSENAEGDRWAFQIAYFKTLRKPSVYDFRPYEMEAIWLMLLRSYKLAPHYTLHLNLHTNYYKDDTMPFSLRRPIPKRNQSQINFTTLHELELVYGWFVLGELGLMDIVQPQWYIHSGASIGRSTKHFAWHFGFSITGTWEALWSPTRRIDYQQLLRYSEAGYNQTLNDDFARNDYGIHPEFSAQVFF